MPTNIPPHVKAWAKVHEWRIRESEGEWYGNRPVMSVSRRVPDADSDAWLAGMVRAMARQKYLEIDNSAHPNIWDVEWGDDAWAMHTLEAAIIAAVLGDQADAT